MRERTALGFCLLAGGGDAVTGLLLAGVPRLVGSWLQLGVPEPALPLLRFVGVFVACVGFAYLYPWLLPDPARRVETAVEITAGARLAVALFLAVSVAAGGMAEAWLLVAGYDATVASAQLGLRARGVFGHG